jgi:hypothetical protein
MELASTPSPSLTRKPHPAIT